MYTKLFSWQQLPVHVIDQRFSVVLCIALFFAFSGLLPSFYTAAQNDEALFIRRKTRMYSLYVAGLVVFILSASYLLGQNFNPFIYFRF